MRVLHLDFDDLANPWGGGQARRTFEVSRRLAETRGWEVTVVTGWYPGAHPTEVPVSRGRLRYERAGGGPFPLNVLSFLAAQPLLARRHAHDLLVEDFTTPVGPSGSPLWARRPVIGSAQFLFAEQMARKYRLPFDRVERALLGRYRRLIALTEVGAARLRAASPGADVAVIPQGLTPEDFVPVEAAEAGGASATDAKNGADATDATGATGATDAQDGREDDAYALYLGRLDAHQKGLDVLLRAWALVPAAERPPLVLAGDGRDRPMLERLVSALGLSASVRFAGRVHGEVKRQLLRSARFVCLPTRYDTFPIVSIEVLAAGRPLLTTALPELREVVSPGAVFVPPDDPRALAAEAAALWRDAARRRALAERGRASVEGLTWDRVAREQAAVYERATLGAAL